MCLPLQSFISHMAFSPMVVFQFLNLTRLLYCLYLSYDITFWRTRQFVHLATQQRDSLEGPTHEYNLRSQNIPESSLTYVRNHNKNLKDQSSNFYWRAVNSPRQILNNPP